MSFIINDDLKIILAGLGAKDLIKTADGVINTDDRLKSKFFTDQEKKAIEARGVPAYEVAKPFLINLQRKVDPASAPPATNPLGSQADNKTPPANVQDFRTLGDFLTWAAQNKLTWGGKRFAWMPEEQAEALQNQAWTFTTEPTNRNNRDPNTRQTVKSTAYATKDQVIAYLTYLRDKVAPTNKVLEVMLKSLIEEFNVWLRSAGQQGIDSKSKPSIAQALEPDAVVDAFLSDTLDFSKWQDGLTGYPTFVGSYVKKLTVKDLSSQGAFTNWLRFFKIKFKDANNKDVVTEVLNPEGDPCLAVHILYKRAQYLSGVAAGAEEAKPKYTQMVELYNRAVVDYGRAFKKDGAICAVSYPGNINQIPGGPGGKPGGQPGGQPGGPGGAGGLTAVDMATLQEVVQNLPFLIDVIDFDRIDLFLKSVVKVMPRDTAEYAPHINDAMKKASELSKFPAVSLNLSSDPRQIANTLNKGSVSYCNFMYQMMNVVSYTRNLVSKFRIMFESKFTDARSLQLIIGQVGKHETDSYGIATRNYLRLSHLSRVGKCEEPPAR